MAIDFPNSPTLNQDYTVGTTTWTYDGTKWILKTYNSLHAVPVTAMMLWANTTYPTGWLLADGSAISRTTYSDLFTAIGTTYGVGDGSSTFNLPNMPSAGTGSPNTIIKVTNSGALEPSAISHAANHTQGGSDVVSVTLNQVPSFQTYRNRIINGSFDAWQRGTSFSFTGVSGTYTADRWAFYMDGTGSAATISRQAFTPGTAPVSGYESAYFIRINRTAAGTGNTYSNFQQPIEDVRTFAGQTITVSFWAKADAARTLGLYLTQDFGTGGSSAVGTSTSTASVTTSWQRFSYTYTLPSIAGKTISATDSKVYMFFQCGNAVSTFDIWGVQVESGSVMTPFEVEPFETTLRKCQRYYQVNDAYVTPAVTPYTTVAIRPTMRGNAAYSSGGGSGFTTLSATSTLHLCYQTTAAQQSLAFNAEL